jgi:hypothetical protein
LSGGLSTRQSTQSKKGKGSRAFILELSDDDEFEDILPDYGLDVPVDPQWPWLRDYRVYMDTPNQVPEGWSMIQWWGVSASVSVCIMMRY